MDEQIPIQEEPPKKKRGWQKGRKRGPRKPLEAPQTPVPPQPLPPATPPAPANPEPSGAYEPLSVSGVTASGSRFTFLASDFSRQNGNYTFVSYPPTRGFEMITVLWPSQLAMLEITGPIPMVDKLKAPVVVTAPVGPPPSYPIEGAMAPPSGPIVYGPNQQIVRPPYYNSDPRQAVRDAAAQAGETIRNPAGVPVSVVSKPAVTAPDPRGVLAGHAQAEPAGTETILATMG